MRKIFVFLMATLDGYQETTAGEPVVLGSGHPVLAGAEQTALQLTRIRQFGSGNVLLTYRPAG
jgi:hypothetical protein